MSGSVKGKSNAGVVNSHGYHRRNVSDSNALNKGWTAAGAPPVRREARMVPPPRMRERAFKPLPPPPRTQTANAPRRSSSLRQPPARPSRQQVTARDPPAKRPSLKSIGSDGPFNPRTSTRLSLASSDPGTNSIYEKPTIESLKRQGANDLTNFGFSDDVRKFILEAEQAFESEEDLKFNPLDSSSRERSVSRKRQSGRKGAARPVFASRPSTRPLSTARKSAASGQRTSRGSSTSRPLKSTTTAPGNMDSTNVKPLPPVPRRASTVAAKRSSTIKKRQPVPTRSKGTWETRMEAKGTKWGLSEGMTDILSGQRFKKVEVDEMLTPDRLMRLKSQQEDEEARSSTESLGKTLTSPHLAKTPLGNTIQTHAGNSKPGRSNSWIDVEVESPDELIGANVPPVQAKLATFSLSTNDEEYGEEVPIMIQGVSDDEDMPSPYPGILGGPELESQPPTPPPRSARRLPTPAATPGVSSAGLRVTFSAVDNKSPSIAPSTDSMYTDASFSPGPATPLSPMPPLPPNPIERKLNAAEDEANIYLRSTPYTMTQPSFEHGPITFSKAEVGKGAMKMDETMDWTAFQMAILGGANDIGDIVDDYEDTRLADDLVEWFDDHGFEDWGRMINEDEAMRELEDEEPSEAELHDLKATTAPQAARGSISSASSSTSSLSSDMSATSAAPQPLNIRRKRPPLPTLTSRCLPSRDGSLGNSMQSLVKTPAVEGRSPMVVGDTGPGGVHESVADAPMGFNLNNDLGDFLQYEAEYAYATDL